MYCRDFVHQLNVCLVRAVNGLPLPTCVLLCLRPHIHTNVHTAADLWHANAAAICVQARSTSGNKGPSQAH